MQVQRDLLDAPWVAPEVKQAVLELERLQADQRVRDLYEARQEKQWLERTLIAGARMEGVEEGFEKGVEKGVEKGRVESTRALAQRMLHAGLPIEQVMAITELSRDEVEQLAADLPRS